MIGQFSGPYFTVPRAKLKFCLILNLLPPFETWDKINILITPFSWSFLLVMELRFALGP